MSYLSVNGLTKRFGDIRCFQDLRFEIEEGEFITLLGPSGCGKSALLRTLAGLAPADAGSVCMAGREVACARGDLDLKERYVALLFQSDTLSPRFTVFNNIAHSLKTAKFSRPEVKDRVRRILQRTGLTDYAQCYPCHLSRGQRQMTLLARALATEPRLVLLDEPVNALDAQIRQSWRLQIRDLLKSFHIAAIYVTRDQDEALTVSDRIFLMDRGRITHCGAPQDLYTDPQSEFAARFTGNYNIFRTEELGVCAAGQPDAGVLAVRPAAIELIPNQTGRIWEDGPERVSFVPDRPDSIHLEGLLVDIVPLGNIMRHFVRVGRRILMADLEKLSPTCPAKPGQSVSLWIPYGECYRLKSPNAPFQKPA